MSERQASTLKDPSAGKFTSVSGPREGSMMTTNEFAIQGHHTQPVVENSAKTSMRPSLKYMEMSNLSGEIDYYLLFIHCHSLSGRVLTQSRGVSGHMDVVKSELPQEDCHLAVIYNRPMSAQPDIPKDDDGGRPGGGSSHSEAPEDRTQRRSLNRDNLELFTGIGALFNHAAERL